MDHLFIGYDKDFYDAIPYVKAEPGPDWGSAHPALGDRSIVR